MKWIILYLITLAIVLLFNYSAGKANKEIDDMIEREGK